MDKASVTEKDIMCSGLKIPLSLADLTVLSTKDIIKETSESKINITIKTLPQNQFENLVDYFLNLSPADVKRMCIDQNSLLSRDEWIQFLIDDSHKPLKDRQLYYLGWYLNEQLIGHSGINKIVYGAEAYIHLHIWQPELRCKGLGKAYLWKAMQFYFEKFNEFRTLG